MTRRPPRAPRLPRAVLRAVVDPVDREFLLADLDEEYARRCGRDGRSGAGRWYWIQTITSVVPSLRRRARRWRTRARGGEGMTGFLQDLRVAARGFARRPSFTLVAVGTLTLAIGANAAMFSVVNGVLLKPVPGLDGTDGLVEITRDVDGQYFDMSYPVVQALARDASTLEHVAAMALSPVALGAGEAPAMHMSLSVTASYFDALRIEASRGRFFAADEATFPRVRPRAVVSHQLWTGLGMPEVPGTTLTVNGVPLDLIGVGPVGFRGHAALPVDLYVPMGASIPGLRSPNELGNPRSGVVEVLARLAPGASAGQAHAEVVALADAVIVAATDDAAGRYQARVEPWGRIPGAARGPITAFFVGLLAVTALVLATACINVGGMLLSRSVTRGDEMALRMAVGAGRGRIVRQLLAEALFLAVVAGLAAIPLASWAANLLLAFEPPLPAGYTLSFDFGLDWAVLAYTFGLALVAALVFNLAPALYASRTDVMGSLKGGGRSGRRTRTPGRALLVGGQIALSLVLLTMGGLFLRALSSLQGADPGWETENVLTLEVDLEQVGLGPVEARSFFREVRERLTASSGVVAAGVASKLPLSGASSFGDVHVDGATPPEGQAGFEALVNRVSPGWFESLGIERLAGRDIEASDDERAARVAVVSRTMARRLWPGGDPLGRVFRLGSEEPIEMTVVGVVEDSRYTSMSEAPRSVYFVPLAQWHDASVFIAARAVPGREDEVRTFMAAVVAELQPSLPPVLVSPLADRLAFGLMPQRVAAWVSGIMGLLGLALGAVGVYGMTAFAVSQRVREVGIRLALGARRLDVLRLLVRQGMTAPVVGLVVGGVFALASARLVAPFLGDVRPTDPVAFGTATLILLLVALLAIVVPAVAAARRDPVPSLREE